MKKEKSSTKFPQRPTTVNSLVATFSKGVKSDLLTMIAISRGIVVGMLADTYLGRRQNHYEASLRSHVLSVAQERGFGTFLEVRIPRIGRNRLGAFKKLDYVLSYGRQAIAIECKTIRSKYQFLDKQGVKADIAKLTLFPSYVPEGIRASGWFVVADCTVVDSKTTAEIIEKRFIKQVSKQTSIPIACIKKDNDLIATGSRSATQDLAILSCGQVGSYYAGCIAVCVALT